MVFSLVARGWVNVTRWAWYKKNTSFKRNIYLNFWYCIYVCGMCRCAHIHTHTRRHALHNLCEGQITTYWGWCSPFTMWNSRDWTLRTLGLVVVLFTHCAMSLPQNSSVSYLLVCIRPSFPFCPVKICTAPDASFLWLIQLVLVCGVASLTNHTFPPCFSDH